MSSPISCPASSYYHLHFPPYRFHDMNQCLGITRQGRRCRIQVKGQYCQHHGPVTPFESEKGKGIIYTYTLVHLLERSPKKKDWLQIKHLDSTDLKAFDPRKHILVKIGMTAGSVMNRLKQWEAKCSHKLAIVDPYRRRKSFLSSFQCLKVTEEYNYYSSESHGFICSENVFAVEQAIHRALRFKYGRGDVHCHACKEQGHGLHIEWFKIPRSDIKAVFSLMDDTVAKYTRHLR